jgi:phage FluMu gp28-like protein
MSVDSTTTSIAVSAPREAESILLDYQREFAFDPAPVKVWEKSRQIGATWDVAAAVTLKAAAGTGSEFGLRRPDHQVWYVGYNLDMAREFIDMCAMWAGRFDKAASAIEQIEIVDEREDDRGNRIVEIIKAFQITFASGHKIVALSSRPANFRGRHGIALLDEFAFHDRPEALLEAALALTIWGGEVWVWSSHNGIGCYFNVLVNDIRAGKLAYAIHKTTFDDALTAGLYRKICAALGEEWTQAKENAWRDETYKRYGDKADQELRCIPRTKAGAWLPYDLIISCEDPDAGNPVLYAGGPVVIGNDIGRRRDLWIAWVCEIIGDVLWTREIVELHNQKFAVQDAEIARLENKYKMLRLAMDQTGMGEKPVEDMQRAYPGKVEGVLLTSPMRLNLATILKQRFERRGIRIPEGHLDLRGDLNNPRMEVGITGASHLVAARDEHGHADRFWAGALACAAAEITDAAPEMFIPRDADETEDAA